METAKLPHNYFENHNMSDIQSLFKYYRLFKCMPIDTSVWYTIKMGSQKLENECTLLRFIADFGKMNANVIESMELGKPTEEHEHFYIDVVIDTSIKDIKRYEKEEVAVLLPNYSVA